MQPLKKAKEVNLVAYAFDCLPGHVTISGRAQASSLRVAAVRALEKIFRAPELKRKRVSDFKISLVVTK